MEEVLKDFAMGFITAREAAEKLIDMGINDMIFGAFDSAIVENARRVKIERDSFLPALDKFDKMCEEYKFSHEIHASKKNNEGIIMQQFSVTIYSSFTDAKETFTFDNNSVIDNASELRSMEKFVEENC